MVDAHSLGKDQALIAADGLRRCKEALDSIGVPFCIMLGTALGAYRDKDFCPGDIDDIDIAIPVEYFPRFAQISEALKQHGFWEGSHFDMPPTEEHPYGLAPERAFYRPQDGHPDGGWKNKIDIFFLTPYDEKNMCWVFYAQPPQVRLIDRKYFTDFANLPTIEFFGTHYPMPRDIESYLAANYGENWRTPIHRDFYLWSRDNQCPIV